MLTERSCGCELSDLQGCVAEPVNTDLKAAGGRGLEGGQGLLAKGEKQQLTGEGPVREHSFVLGRLSAVQNKLIASLPEESTGSHDVLKYPCW